MFYSKYGAKKTIVDGIKFDSQMESRQYIKLKEMEEKGEIKNLQLQPEFLLQDSFKKDGKTYRKIVYKADFMFEKDGKTCVQDVKGFATPEFKIKEKLFEYKYPNLNLEIVKKVK